MSSIARYGNSSIQKNYPLQRSDMVAKQRLIGLLCCSTVSSRIVGETGSTASVVSPSCAIQWCAALAYIGMAKRAKVGVWKTVANVRSANLALGRTFEASIVRRLFSPSPTDPRYHMLADLSKKFDLGPENQTHEARAALFLNRFTRTLTIMYATSSIERIVGLPKEELERKSFYYCITLECLADAVRHLESAKGIDSIAYMRFMFRDPRQNYHVDLTSPESQDHEMRYVASDNDRRIVGSVRVGNQSPSSGRNLGQQISGSRGNGEEHPPTNFHTGPADSTAPKEMLHSVLDGGSRKHSTTTSLEGSPHIELEAVVSCTTDGLVVCLRRARPARLGTMPASR